MQLKSYKNLIVVSLLTALLLTAGKVFFKQSLKEVHQDGKAGENLKEKLVEPRTLGPEQTELPDTIIAGLRLVYDLSGQGYVDPAKPIGFQGLLEQIVVATEPTLAVLWRFQTLQLQPQGQLADSDREKIIEIARLGTITQWNEDGVMQAVAYDEFWQGLLARIQFSLPKPGANDQWQSREWTGMGQFPARYWRQTDSGEWKKVLKGQIEQHFSLQIHCSAESPTLPFFVSLDCQEQIQFVDQHAMPSIKIHNQTSLSLKYWDYTTIPEGDDMKLQLAQSERKRTMEEQLHRQQLGEQGLDEIISLIKGESESSAQLQHYLSLKAWIFLHPEKLQELLKLLRHENFPSPLLRTSVRALTSIGHEAAQAALREMISWYQDDAQALRYMLSQFALLEYPDMESEALLREIAQQHNNTQVRHSSQLALSVVGYRLQAQEDQHQRFEAIEKDVFERLEKSSERSELLTSLSYLGNLGSPKALDYIKHNWQRAEAEVKLAMLRSLRLVQDPAVLYWLEQALLEAEAAIRSQAIQVLSLRKELSRQEIEPILRLMGKELSSQVRADWVQFLVSLSYRNPELSQMLMDEWQRDMQQQGISLEGEIQKIVEEAALQIQKQLVKTD